jgi:hypothetical protein
MSALPGPNRPGADKDLVAKKERIQRRVTELRLAAAAQTAAEFEATVTTSGTDGLGLGATRIPDQALWYSVTCRWQLG